MSDANANADDHKVLRQLWNRKMLLPAYDVNNAIDHVKYNQQTINNDRDHLVRMMQLVVTETTNYELRRLKWRYKIKYSFRTFFTK